MKTLIKIFIPFFALLFMHSAFSAETRYVSENINTYLRKGAGDQYKIMGTIQSGEKVTLLNQKDRYTLIRDSRSREGWILTNELTLSLIHI